MTLSLKMSALHKAKEPKVIVKLLDQGADVRARDERKDAPIHAIARRAVSKEKFECMMALLVNATSDDMDINITTEDDMTALHIVVETRDILCVKALVAFGADVNCLNRFGLTALDIAMQTDNMALLEFLCPLGAFPGDYVTEVRSSYVREKVPVPKLPEETEAGSNEPDGASGGGKEVISVKLKEFQGGQKRLQLHAGALQHLQDKLEALPTSLTQEDVAAVLQLNEFKKVGINPGQGLLPTGDTPLVFHVDGGERILCLDGGGIKGLIQIEVLMQIEQLTGRKITELFNWIVGTSTGGVIALAMVYAKKTLPELRRLYFEMKDKVFPTPSKSGYGCDNQKLEELFKTYLGKDTRLTDTTHPKVMVTAVDCRDTRLHLRFFNNCFCDEYSDELLWKVARYTSAAPVFFTPMDNYVDGGVRANNPTDYALTKIQSFLDEQAAASKGPKPQYGCVVSVGCGIIPPEKIGDFSIEKYMNMFIGKKLLHLTKYIAGVEELIRLLSNAMLESEGVADNCRSRCEKQNIPFYRFSPELDEDITLSERDNEKLVEIVVKTKVLLQSMDAQVDELVQLFYHLLDRCKKFTADGRPKFTHKT